MIEPSSVPGNSRSGFRRLLPVDDGAFGYVSSRSRPLGVTLIALLHFVGIGIVALALLFLPGAGIPTWGVVLVFLLVALTLATGLGLWRLKLWGYWLAVLTYGLSSVFTVCTLFGNALSPSELAGTILGIVILLYLLRPQVRAVFGA